MPQHCMLWNKFLTVHVGVQKAVSMVVAKLRKNADPSGCQASYSKGWETFRPAGPAGPYTMYHEPYHCPLRRNIPRRVTRHVKRSYSKRSPRYPLAYSDRLARFAAGTSGVRLSHRLRNRSSALISRLTARNCDTRLCKYGASPCGCK